LVVERPSSGPASGRGPSERPAGGDLRAIERGQRELAPILARASSLAFPPWERHPAPSAREVPRDRGEPLLEVPAVDPVPRATGQPVAVGDFPPTAAAASGGGVWGHVRVRGHGLPWGRGGGATPRPAPPADDPGRLLLGGGVPPGDAVGLGL